VRLASLRLRMTLGTARAQYHLRQMLPYVNAYRSTGRK